MSSHDIGGEESGHGRQAKFGNAVRSGGETPHAYACVLVFILACIFRKSLRQIELRYICIEHNMHRMHGGDREGFFDFCRKRSLAAYCFGHVR